MSRIVVVLQYVHGGPPQIYLQEPCYFGSDIPAAIQNFSVADLLQRINAQPLAPDSVKDVGTQLLDLLAQHPIIAANVLPNLNAQVTDEQPIYLVVRDPEFEKLPWEALHTPDAGFVCNEKRWPLARSRAIVDGVALASFLPPLRMMVIMGASGNSALTRLKADGEWENLYTAVKSSGLNIRMRVLLCQEELKEKIDAEGVDWIDTQLLTESAQLLDDIDGFAPHLLHFYCHGVANPVPALHIASTADWELENDGSIQLESSQLYDRANLKKSTWLVTLNCCESAQAAQAGCSRSVALASSLVNQGVPAVVGMRERFEASLAHTFCGLFYKALLCDLKDRLDDAAQSKSREVHWACGLYAARQGICEELAKGLAGDPEYRNVAAVAASAKEWTIPVIYAGLKTFHLKLLKDPDGTHPVARPRAVAANTSSLEEGMNGASDSSLPKSAKLTLDCIRNLADERNELLTLREQFKDRTKTVETIDARIGEIDQLLG